MSLLKLQSRDKSTEGDENILPPILLKVSNKLGEEEVSSQTNVPNEEQVRNFPGESFFEP